MNVKVFALITCCSPTLIQAQGFAGLGTAADGFSEPQRGYEFQFPMDHGPHPDFRIEWWYITANMTGSDGNEYGLQWTLFRSALAPFSSKGWSDPQLYMAHAAVTSKDTHLVAERLSRGGVGTAGVRAEPFEAWIDEWSFGGRFDSLNLTASSKDFSFDVALSSDGPMIFHGDDGFSVKSVEGQASYYFSLPYLSLSGELALPEGKITVTGEAWLDREWSSQPLSENQSGWDWFSMSFEDRSKMMGFRLRQSDDTYFTAATWIEPDGTTIAYPNGAFNAEPLNEFRSTGATLPTQWRVMLADKGVDVIVEALNPNAWMSTSIPYWEGPIRIEGSHKGRGYLEMTGYE